MADESTNQRIILSRHTLGLYERNGLPGGPIEAAVKILCDEIDVLNGIVAAFPEKALTVGDLVRRWQALADGLRVRAN
jgi:hypothetical protein